MNKENTAANILGPLSMQLVHPTSVLYVAIRVMRLNYRCDVADDNYTLILARTFSIIYNYKIAMTKFGVKFLQTINWFKTHSCRCNLTPIILKGNQMIYS